MDQVGNPELDQYFTPWWAPGALWERYFNDVPRGANVADPGCGRGAFLDAVPKEMPNVVGVEIAPDVAAFAGETTGRDVLVGDFATIALPFRPDVLFGNPPFSREKAEAFVARAAELLPHGGRCGFVLPTSFLSFASTLEKWQDKFSIEQDMLPRDLFPRIRYPLSFYMFTADGLRRLRGFALFNEAHAVNGMPPSIKLALVKGGTRGGVWKPVVKAAMRALGGRAKLDDLNRYIAGKRPRLIPTWKATVRRVVQECFVNVGPGEWAEAECA